MERAVSLKWGSECVHKSAWQQSVAVAGKRRLMSLNPRTTDGCSYDRDLLKIERVCSDRSLPAVFMFSTFSPSNISCEIVTKAQQSSWNHCLMVPCPISPENGSNLSGCRFIFQKNQRFINYQGSIKDGCWGWQKEVEKKKQSALKQWQNGTHWGGKKQQDIGEGVSRNFSCTAAKGRTYEGAEGSGTLEAGVW